MAQIGPTRAAHGIEVSDLGDLQGPANPWQPPRDGVRHLHEVAAWNSTLHDAVHGALKPGHPPCRLAVDLIEGLPGKSTPRRP